MASPKHVCYAVPENPWDDAFRATRHASQEGDVTQNWNDDPFYPTLPHLQGSSSSFENGTPTKFAGTSTHQSPRCVDMGSDFLSNEISSVGSGNHSSISTYSGGAASRRSSITVGTTIYRLPKRMAFFKPSSYNFNDSKSRLDAKREQAARKKALSLADAMAESGDIERGSQVRIMLKTWADVKMAETSRKNVTSTVYCHDPETVSGMKSAVDAQMEIYARKKAALMISDGRFPYDENASHLGDFLGDTPGYRHPPTREGDKRVQPIV